MKLNYRRQLTLTIVIGLFFNVLNTVFRHWVFSSIGTCLAGLLWIVHPVMIGNDKPEGRDRRLVQLAGVALVVFGIFSRSYFY